MAFKSFLAATALALLPAVASAQIDLDTVVARIASPVAQSGAVYMTITNGSDADDRLVRVESTAAARVEIHTNIQDDSGVMRMQELEDGIALESGATHRLAPGGDHIMLMGLTEPLDQGDTFDLILHFDTSPPMTVTATVDNEAANALANGAMTGHSGN